MLSCQHFGGGPGRVATVSHDVDWLQDRHDRPGLKAIGKIDAVRTYIMSAEIPPERLLELTRNHRRIENCLHWVLDVVTGEDQMRNRTLCESACNYVPSGASP